MTRADERLAAQRQIARWRESPLAMVRDLFKVEPDLWQQEALEAFPSTPQLCLKACKGPGKSCLLAWIGWNFMLTRPFPMVGVTSISGDNLKANLWTELARWREKSELLRSAFEMTKTEIFSRDHPKTWKMEARTWARDADAAQIGTTLAGLHANYVMWLLDESGDYPDAIMPVCEAIFAGGPIEAHIIQAGNPLKLSGPLYKACTSAKRFWKVITITGDPDDPKRSPRISVEHARNQIEQYGRESSYVKTNIFGEFPNQSPNALIGPDEVAASMKRFWREHDIGDAAKVLGVDVADQGDDPSVIASRHGIQMYPFKKYRNISGPEGAGILVRHWRDWDADACFVDRTGGYGTSWIDHSMALGKTPIGIPFSGKAHRSERYFNKRTEMAFDLVEWIKRGGALPEDDRLTQQLTTITYEHRGDKMLLEPKDSVKDRLGFSTDEMDACMLTHAEPVVPMNSRRRTPRQQPQDYRPFADLDRAAERSFAETGEFNPFRERY